MALIDRTVVKALIEGQLLTVNGTAVQAALFAGDSVPTGTDRWCKLIAIDLDALPADPRSGGPDDAGADLAGVVVTVNCFASARAMRESSGSLSSVMAAVGAALAGRCLIDAGTTHQVDLTDRREIEDREIDGNRSIATGAVVLTGTVTRTSGNSATALV